MFDIETRLKEMDPGYFVVRNEEFGRFEVHSGNGFEFVCPYPNLDVRVLQHARRTRIENADEMFDEMELVNLENQASAEAKMDEQLKILSDRLNYAYHTSKEVKFL